MAGTSEGSSSQSRSPDLHSARAPLTSSKTCRYELSPDAHFVAAPHPEHPSVWLLGGGSGHGFKHSAAVGEVMAELALYEQCQFDLTPFRLAERPSWG